MNESQTWGRFADIIKTDSGANPSPMKRLPSRDLDHILSHTAGQWEELRGQRVFLTGGTGFVGSWLLESLLWADDKLRLGVKVVVLTRNPDAFQRKMPHLCQHRAVRLLAGNLLELEFPEDRHPFVIHAATEPALDVSPGHPLGAFAADIEATRRMLEFARTHGTRRFLFTSSGAIYGRQPTSMTHVPEDYPGAPATTDTGSAYGQAKRVSEFMCAKYGRAYGFETTIARLFAFVGPRLPLDGHYAVGNFIRDALAGGPVRVAGDGTPYRSYLYAADLAIWLWAILLRGKPAYPYNVGSPQPLTIAELAQTVVRVTDPAACIETARQPVPGAEPLRYVPRTGRAQHELGLHPAISAEEGIRRTVEWLRAGESGLLPDLPAGGAR